MGSTYTPTYYTSLHDSITSICKNILPFSFKKWRIPAITAAEHRLSKQQSDNLKWQQESFHQMLKLMGLCKEGIIEENEVSAFRTHLIDTITTPASMDYEPPLITRDKLIFLQELLHAKCIAEDEYHASKKPLLRSLGAQGAKIRESDVIVGARNDFSSEECPPVIGLKEKRQRLQNELVCSTENPFWNRENESESKSILMTEVLPEATVKAEKGKKKPPFRSLFQRDKMEEGLSCPNNEQDPASEDIKTPTAVKRTWGFNGFKKWKKNDTEDETAPLSLGEKSDDCRIVGNPNEEGPDTKYTNKNNLHQYSSQPNFYVEDEAIVGEKAKYELSQIKADRSARSPRLNLSDNQMENITTRQRDENAHLKILFPESSCDQHVLLDVVRKEVEGPNAGEMGSSTKEMHDLKRWSTFDDEENTHPNLFAPQCHSYNSMMQDKFITSSMNAHTSFNESRIDSGFRFNPFSEM